MELATNLDNKYLLGGSELTSRPDKKRSILDAVVKDPLKDQDDGKEFALSKIGCCNDNNHISGLIFGFINVTKHTILNNQNDKIMDIMEDDDHHTTNYAE